MDSTFFNFLCYKSKFAKDAGKRNFLTPGKLGSISIAANDFVSKRIEEGSKLVLMIDVVKSLFGNSIMAVEGM